MLKIFNVDGTELDRRAHFEAEVQALEQLRHRNIIKYYESEGNAAMIDIEQNGTKKDVAYIALEAISNGEFLTYINTGPFSEPICRYFFYQMLKGLQYVHSIGLTQRDFKPDNILL